MSFTSILVQRPTRGGAAIEYVIVSLFAAVVAVASVALVGSIVQKKVRDLTTKMGIEEVELELDGF
jgi:Flp pilus assembly pilin Flp